MRGPDSGSFCVLCEVRLYPKAGWHVENRILKSIEYVNKVYDRSLRLFGIVSCALLMERSKSLKPNNQHDAKIYGPWRY